MISHCKQPYHLKTLIYFKVCLSNLTLSRFIIFYVSSKCFALLKFIPLITSIHTIPSKKYISFEIITKFISKELRPKLSWEPLPASLLSLVT